jgi:hypothetical protein
MRPTSPLARLVASKIEAMFDPIRCRTLKDATYIRILTSLFLGEADINNSKSLAEGDAEPQDKGIARWWTLTNYDIFWI